MTEYLTRGQLEDRIELATVLNLSDDVEHWNDELRKLDMEED